MRMIAPRTGAPEVTIAEDQLEYKPVVAGVYQAPNGATVLLTRWQPTEEERLAILMGDDIFVGIMTFGAGIQPFTVRVGPGEYTVDETA